ncbi:MAG TPA: hypothetical protein VE029_05490 [Rhizobacter sp.]|nr:hypothetical protein [Rhizobacter sp.]
MENLPASRFVRHETDAGDTVISVNAMRAEADRLTSHLNPHILLVEDNAINPGGDRSDAANLWISCANGFRYWRSLPMTREATKRVFSAWASMAICQNRIVKVDCSPC